MRGAGAISRAALLLLGMGLVPSSGAAASIAAEALARLLVAGDLADRCPQFVQRPEGRGHDAFVSEGLVRVIGDYDVTMAELVQVSRDYDQQGMELLKRSVLQRRGVNPDDSRRMCFFALRIVGQDDEIGRYLERR